MREGTTASDKTEDYYLNVIQVGSQEAATRRLQNIKRDLASLGKTSKGSGAQVVFSVLLTGGWEKKGGNGKLLAEVMVSGSRFWVLWSWAGL